MQVKNGSPDVTINSFTGFLKVSSAKMTTTTVRIKMKLSYREWQAQVAGLS